MVLGGMMIGLLLSLIARDLWRRHLWAWCGTFLMMLWLSWVCLASLAHPELVTILSAPAPFALLLLFFGFSAVAKRAGEGHRQG
jgi:hypothetical protein